MESGCLRLLCLVILLAGCASPSPTKVPIPSTSPAEITTLSPVPPTLSAPTLSPAITATPGVILWGSVHHPDGSGLAGVIICRSYASYPGVQVALTDAQGQFRTSLAYIPGDEMITVWPFLPGYTFQPEQEYWRHYYGLEVSRMDFTATTAAATGTPPKDCR
jgi:hypothetical protein